MSEAWARVPERGNATALAIIHWIGTSVGRGMGRVALLPVAAYFLLTASVPRQASRAFLSRAFGRRAGWGDVFHHIYTFAVTILDRVYLLAGQFDRFEITVHGVETIRAQVASGRGCILLSAHLGSFEVLRTLGAAWRHFPVKVLMNVDHNRGITRFLAALNPRIAETIIPIRGPETLLAAREWIEQGGILGILGDRVISDDRAIVCRFLGQPARFPAGPLRLATVLGCPVILAFGLYRDGARYDLHFEALPSPAPLPGDAPATARSPDMLAAWTQRYADRLAHYAVDAPYNWFNFFDFWAGGETAADGAAAARPRSRPRRTTAAG